MEIEKSYLIDTFIAKKDELEDLLNKVILLPTKSSEKSENARKEGNALFWREKHDSQIHIGILNNYNKSIALATSSSEELAFAYSNRSAYLIHIGLFEESIKDVNKALDITKSNALKFKLLCRKVECLKALGLPNYMDSLKMAKACLDEINNKNNREKLKKMLEKATKSSVNTDEKLEKQSKNKLKIKEILQRKDISLVRDNVDINYNEKYGRHLIAKKDFEPGEIIFTENVYATVLSFDKLHLHCSYCLKTCWSGIPCDHCSNVIFCNENCKQQAWEKFHDIECSLYSNILNQENIMSEHYFMSLRMLVLGLKEAGSIKALKDKLESIDKCFEMKNKGFTENKKFVYNTFASIYSLKGDGLSDEVLEKLACRSCDLIINMIKHTLIFEVMDKYKKIEDLVEDEKVIFLGSLFVKLCTIKIKNAHEITIPVENGNKTIDYKLGLCTGSFSSLLNHSCDPNVMRCFTDDQKFVLYAICAIKKDEQIFDTYGYLFCNNDKDLRQYNLNLTFQFNCDCPACKQNWPPMSSFPTRKIGDYQEIELQIYHDCIHILDSVNVKNATFDQKSIEVLSNCMRRARNHFKQPAQIIILLTEGLQKVYNKIYRMQPQLLFAACNRMEEDSK